jgi:hypothetical protein
MNKKYTKTVTFIYSKSLNKSMETESIIVKALGGTPWAKIMDHFIVFREFDHTRYHVAETTGVARLTVDKIWSKMMKMEFIVSTRNIGNAEYFKFNMRNPTVKAIIKMTNEIIKIETYKELETPQEPKPIPIRGYR